MKSTALGAENIIFISDAHEKFYYEKLQEVRYQDGKQRCWIRGDTDGGNNEGGEGFIDLSEAEQMALPFN